MYPRRRPSHFRPLGMHYGGLHGFHDRITRRMGLDSFGFSPNPWQFTLPKELKMNHVWIAADGTILDIMLFHASRWVERNHDLFAAGGADICPFILRTKSFLLSLFHDYTTRFYRQAKPSRRS